MKLNFDQLDIMSVDLNNLTPEEPDALSARSLADIGVARSDIESVNWSGAGDASRRQH